jgi:hypothetical protein
VCIRRAAPKGSGLFRTRSVIGKLTTGYPILAGSPVPDTRLFRALRVAALSLVVAGCGTAASSPVERQLPPANRFWMARGRA